jgi:hypothetical protein
MRLLVWAGGMVASIGALGGILGALSNRAARPGPTLGESFSAYLAGRARFLASTSRPNVRSSG